MASLNSHGIQWYRQPTAASTDAPAALIQTPDLADHCYASAADYPLLEDYCFAAERYIERRARKMLMSRTYDFVLSAFPPDDDPLELPITPVRSIASLAYYNTANGSTSLASTDYDLHQSAAGYSFLTPTVDTTWPATKPRRDAVTIQLVAGHGSESTDMPQTMRQAAKMIVAHWYANREAAAAKSIKEIETGVDALLMAENPGFYP